jgi:hypothetical protein
MFGHEINFFRDPTYRFHKAIVLDRVLPPRIRGWISIFTGTIIFVYVGVMLAPLLQAKLSSGVPLPASYQKFFGEKVVIDTTKNVTVPTSAPLPNIVPFIGATRIPLDTESPLGNGIFYSTPNLVVDENA